MDLPFAVDSAADASLQESNTSLVTASSQGSFLQADEPDNAVFDDAFDDYEHGQSIIMEPDMEIIDFTQYVTVSENDASEVDVVINHPGGTHHGGGSDDLLEQQQLLQQQQGDVLSLLLSGNTGVVTQAEEANRSAHIASDAKANGNLAAALHHHSLAAKGFRAAALEARPKDVALSNSLLLLSQSQAKSALALKEFLKKHEGTNAIISSALTQKERLRATVRGALVTNKEADISDSMFLGTATKGSGPSSSSLVAEESKNEWGSSRHEEEKSELLSSNSSRNSKANNNPVDEMLELERELKDMDAALELGNSVASLGTRAQNRLKQSTMDGSFMVVPPGSSYMSSSAMWSRTPPRGNNKANRVQTMLGASATAAVPGAGPTTSHSMAAMIAPLPPQRSTSNTALDASWWGNASTTSQVLAGSVVSIASSSTRHAQVESTNTKQLMRLLDSIKTLGDENAALLREVEEAEAARVEAKAAREQMRRFKSEYGMRFNSLKSALEKFRTNYPEHQDDSLNPVTVSDYLQSSTTIPASFASSAQAANDDHHQQQQVLRQEQLIRKLTADLKKEKDESKKKDGALRKYESFYKEVKARSAEKARQRQAQQRRRTTNTNSGDTNK